MKFRLVSQLESNDCGPACLAMVANFHGQKLTLKQAKELCEVTRMGISVKDILEGGKKIGLQSSGLQLRHEQLQEIPLPAILYWKQDHFVVLYKISRKKGVTQYHIADPGYGKITIEEELLRKEWMGNNIKGIVLAFQETEEFAQVKLKSEPVRQKSLINFLSQYFKKYSLKYLLTALLLVVGLAANWMIPILFKRIIDEGIISKSLNLVIALLAAQFLLFASNSIAQFFSNLLLTKFNFKLSILFKEGFLKKLMRLPVNYFDTRLNTDTLLRLSDLSKIQSYLTWKGISFVINVLNLIVFSIILFTLDQMVFGIYVAMAVLSVIWIFAFLRKRAALEYSMFIRQSENSNNLYEFIMNMPEIKVNHAQNAVISKIVNLQKRLNQLELRSLFLNIYQTSGANFILKLKEIIVIALCAYLIIDSQMTLGTLLSISYILGQLNGPILNLISNLRDTQDAQIAHRRVEDVFSVQDEVDGHDRKELVIGNDDLNLNKVSFKYPGSFNPFVLKNLSFTIPRNKITAIVGTSGSGKTTLMKLLMMYYEPDHGQVNLGNHRFVDLDPDAWRQKCGVVLQDGHIFAGTLKYNITLCDNEQVDEKRLYQAIKIACLSDFTDSLPLGIETKIGSVGMQLSGGQQQRVLIARAVYKNPEFLFFDEATSSLDANTEKVIMNNLNTFFKGRTVVVIAHRLSTVKHADQILVIEKGQLIEKGNHTELVKEKNTYFSLVRNQLELEG